MLRRWVMAVVAVMAPTAVMAAVAVMAALLAANPARAADLTPTELRWLHAALPVLAFARREGLPLDLIVQPQPAPDETPLGMAFVDGRCKLVFSMRGNPLAKLMDDSIAPGLFGPVVEAVVAHEIAHCWRHVARRWGSVPNSAPAADELRPVSTGHAELLREMSRTRREEGFADLVGLAWTMRHHATRYAEVHAWQARFRADQPLNPGPHDTRVWLRLAADPAKFRAATTGAPAAPAAPAASATSATPAAIAATATSATAATAATPATPTASIFEQVEALWLEGLREGT